MIKHFYRRKVLFSKQFQVIVLTSMIRGQQLLDVTSWFNFFIYANPSPPAIKMVLQLAEEDNLSQAYSEAQILDKSSFYQVENINHHTF